MDALTKSRANELIGRIKQHATATFKKQMNTRFGICTNKAVGTPTTVLRLLIKSVPTPDQDLADALWESDIHEARIMASMVADPSLMTLEKLNKWVKDLNSWDICDACCGNLFSKIKNPLKLAEKWMKNDNEFTKRAGFAILSFLALPRAKTSNSILEKTFPLIKNNACDARPMVFKAVNWALRNIGKKNPYLTPKAIACANEILELYPENKSAVWVAKNAIWELNSPKIKALIATRG